MDMGECLTQEQYRDRILITCLGVLGGVAILFSLLFICVARKSTICANCCRCCTCCFGNPLDSSNAELPMVRKSPDDKTSLHKQLDDVSSMVTSQVCSACLNGRAEIMTDCEHYFHRDCIERRLEKEDKCPACGHELPKLLSECAICRLFVVSEIGETKCNLCFRARCPTEYNATQSSR